MDKICVSCNKKLSKWSKKVIELSCGHFFCEPCSTSTDQASCPIDNGTQNPKRASSGFQIANVWQQSISKSQTNDHKCAAHGSEVTMVCMDDKEELCLTCFFQGHRSHDVRQLSEVQKDLARFKEMLGDIKRLAFEEGSGEGAKHARGRKDSLAREKDAVKEQVSKRVERIIEAVCRSGARIAEQIDEVFAVYDNLINQHLQEKEFLIGGYKDMIEELRTSFDFSADIGQLAKLDGSFLKAMSDKGLVSKLETLKAALGELEDCHKFDLAPAHLTKNILKAFDGIPLFNERVVQRLFSEVDLISAVEPLKGKTLSGKVIVGSSQGLLTDRDVSLLAKAVSDSNDSFTYKKLSDPGTESLYDVSFGSPAVARRFAFLDRLPLLKGGCLQVELQGRPSSGNTSNQQPIKSTDHSEAPDSGDSGSLVAKICASLQDLSNCLN